MIQPARTSPRQNNPISIREFKGMDITGTRDIRRSPDMLNCILNDEGTPEMRTGYEKAFPTSLGTGKILGIHKYLNPSGNEVKIVHHGTKLYLFDILGFQPAEIYSGMSGLRHSVAFNLATKICIIDGTKFVVYDGTTAVDAETIAYIPTFLIGTPPGGGGTRNEDMNLIQPRWKQSFSTVAGTTAYTMYGAPLDALESVWIGGVLKTVTTDYTVNLTTGVVTLTANPGAGTNNLVVQVRKVTSGNADRIKKCTVAQTYGGPSDSKVFVSGNPDYPHIDWWTGLPLSGAYDPTYWPDTNYDRIGGDNDRIVGYSVQYDRMVVFKEHSIYLRSWEITTDANGRTVTRYPAVPLNSGEGCMEFDSIEMVENNPFFLSDTGVYEVVGSNVRDERNVRKVSTLVDITTDGNHGHAVDHRDRYYLSCGSGIVWVCDYHKQVKDEASGEYVPVWYKWSGVYAAFWCSDEDYLYFGSDTIGMVYRFKDPSEALPYNDDGAAIPDCHWDMIFSTFERDDLTKLVQKLTITQKPYSHATLVVGYSTEEGDYDAEHEEPLDFMDYNTVDYSRWSYLSTQYEQAFTTRIDNARGIQRFQARLSSTGEIDDFMGFSSIDIIYQYLSGVR